MPRTPDRFPGEDQEEGIHFEDVGTDPTLLGEMVFALSAFRMKDGYGVFDPRWVWQLYHAKVRELIHFIDDGPAELFASGAYREITGQPFPTNVTWYVDNTATQKIVEKIITRNDLQVPTTVVWKIYDLDGTTVLKTATDTIVYTLNVFEANRTRALT